MEKPANAGARRLSGNVVFAADNLVYAAPTSVLQAKTLSHRYGLTPAVAAVVAAHAFPQIDSWRGMR